MINQQNTTRQQEVTPEIESAMPLGHLDDDERFLGVIRKHPFGIVSLYIGGAVAIVAMIVFSILVIPQMHVINGTNLVGITVLLSALIVLAVIFLLISTYLYRQNKLILTDKNITQVLRFGLFSQKVSQLSMSNVEDVTAEQHGIFATMFNYGTVKIETAGEQINFVYTYCPNPRAVARQVLEAREAYVERPEMNSRRMEMQ